MRTLFPFKYLYVGEGSLYVVVVRLKGFRQPENRLPQNGKSFSGERKINLLRMIFSSAQGDLRIKRRCQTIRTFYHSLGLAAVFGLSSTDYIEMGQMLMAL